MLDALTGLRFIAALQVMLFHFVRPLLEKSDHWAVGLIRHGYVGVGLFFVLSGFILAYTYITPQGQFRGTARDFWWARFARVYPVYLVGLIIAAPVFLYLHFRSGVSMTAVIEAIGVTGLGLTVTQAWTPWTACVWNCPGWSLSAEAFFYGLFPFLLPAIIVLSSTKRVVLICAAWLVALALPLSYMATSPDGIASVTEQSRASWLGIVKYFPVARLPEFIIGVALGAEFIGRRSTEKLSGLGWVAIICLALAALVLAHGDIFPYPVLHNSLLTPLFAALIFALAGSTGFVSRLLGSRLFVALGEASYALYIVHLALDQLIRAPWWYDGVPLQRTWTNTAVISAICFTVAWLLFRYVEVPGRVWLKSKFVERRKPVSMRGRQAAA